MKWQLAAAIGGIKGGYEAVRAGGQNMGAVQVEKESTAIDTDPEGHTPEQQAVIEEYQGATDGGILAFVERWRGLKDPNYRKRVRMDIAPVDSRTVQDIKAAIGVDVSGFKGHSLSGSALEHIDKRHGAKGEADHSMADLNDIARMGYVLEHYDSVEPLLASDGSLALSGEHFNADGSRAPMVRFVKRVDGTYYVVDAVPDSAAKELRLVSAYMNKASGSTDRLLNVPQSGPQLTSKTPDGAYTSATGDSIPQSAQDVNPEAQVTAWQNDTEHYLRKYGQKETQAIDTSHSHEGEESGYKQLAPKTSIPQTVQDVNLEVQAAELERGIAELDRQKVERGTQGLGIQGQATVKAMYLEGQSAGDYVQGMRELYAAGQAGVAIESVESEAARSLNDHQRRAAYEAGQMDATAQVNSQTSGNLEGKAAFAKVAGKGKGLVWDSYVEQSVGLDMANRLNEVAKRLNLRVRFVDSILDGWANGQIVEADIRIAKDAEQPIMAVFGHEVGHYLETTAPEAYQAMWQYASQHHMEEINGLMELYAQAGQAQDVDGILKEFLNDDIGRMIAQPEVLNRFIEENKNNRTLLQKIADALRALWQKLTEKDRQQVKTAEEALLAALKASEAQAAKLEQAGQVMDFAKATDQRTGPPQDGKFSIDPSFERELELWDGKSKKTF